MNQDTCSGTGSCTDNGFKPAGTSCGSPADTECTNPDSCNGSGSCQANDEPAGTFCGDAGTECVNQDTCSGTGSCTDNGFKRAGTSCGSTADTECTNPDSCNGSGSCQANDEPAGTFCGDAGTECVNQDTCSGTGSCTDNSFKPAGTSCGSPADTECTNPDSCNATGSCLANDEPAGTPCGDAETECVNQDRCKASGSCADSGVKCLLGIFLPPVDSGSTLDRKRNSTLPFKFQVLRVSDGMPITDATAQSLLSSLSLAISGPIPDCDIISPTEIVSASDSTNHLGLTYDAIEDKYVYVWSTKGLTIGCYNSQAILNLGATPLTNSVSQIKLK